RRRPQHGMGARACERRPGARAALGHRRPRRGLVVARGKRLRSEKHRFGDRQRRQRPLFRTGAGTHAATWRAHRERVGTGAMNRRRGWPVAGAAAIAIGSAWPAVANAHGGEAHAGPPGWTFDAWVSVPLALSLLWYLAGALRLRA